MTDASRSSDLSMSADRIRSQRLIDQDARLCILDSEDFCVFCVTFFYLCIESVRVWLRFERDCCIGRDAKYCE